MFVKNKNTKCQFSRICLPSIVTSLVRTFNGKRLSCHSCGVCGVYSLDHVHQMVSVKMMDPSRGLLILGFTVLSLVCRCTPVPIYHTGENTFLSPESRRKGRLDHLPNSQDGLVPLHICYTPVIFVLTTTC